MTRKHKILLVDDHAIFREGLAMIIGQESDMSICGQFEDGNAALKQAGALKPDMVIIDISLDGMSGLDLVKHLRARFPSIRMLVLSMHKEMLYAERALRVGANGYIMKQESGRRLMAAIRHVLKGETYASDAVKEVLLQNIGAPVGRSSASLVGRLSDRELEIFQLISKGYGTRQIADALNLSMKTVETHREHIRDKMNLKSAFELLQYAVEWSVSQRA